jgi:hypothetical protein
MAPGVGRRIVDREIDLDKLRTAIGCGSEADDFHQGPPNGAPLGAGVAMKSRLRRSQRLCHRAGRKVEMKLGVELPFVVASRPDWRGRNSSAGLFHDPFVPFGLLADRLQSRGHLK